jgi:hypothetical protein
MQYPFLTAVLPALDPAKIPDMSVAELDEMLKENLPAKEFEKILSWDDPEKTDALPLYAEMRRFSACLNYRIALIRAEKLKRNDRFDMPDELYAEIDFALSSTTNASALEKEKIVDAVCWRKLDDLEICHEMDLEHLAVYRLKLRLLEKYSGRDEAAGRNNFEAALKKLAGQFNEP